MAHITYPDAVAISKLVYYAPALLSSVYVVHKHGRSRGSGWIFLTIFCLIRIIGAIAQIDTIGNGNHKTALTIALVTAVIGLSPLVLATLGLIARSYHSILPHHWRTFFSRIPLRLIQIAATVGLILCIVGATNADDPVYIESETTVHIGIIMYTVVLAALVLLTGGAIHGVRLTGQGEIILILAVSLALPFLVVRLLYAILAAFSHDARFKPATGSTTIALFMDTIQEMAVVAIYLLAGIKVPVISNEKDDARHADATDTTSGASRIGQTRQTGRSIFGSRRPILFSLVEAVGKTARRHNQKGQYRLGETNQEAYPLSSRGRDGTQ